MYGGPVSHCCWLPVVVLLLYILKVKSPNKLKNRSEETEAACQQLIPLVSTFMELKAETSAKSKWTWSKSQLHSDLDKASKEVTKLRKVLENIGMLHYNFDRFNIDEADATVTEYKANLTIYNALCFHTSSHTYIHTTYTQNTKLI